MRNKFILFLLIALFCNSSYSQTNGTNSAKDILGSVKKSTSKAIDFLGELFKIQGLPPKKYIPMNKVELIDFNQINSVPKIKEVNPEFSFKVLNPKIEKGKGKISLLIGDFNYFKYLKNVNKEDIEYIKLKSKNAECYVTKFVLNKKVKNSRNFCFVLDHSGSMGDKRANILQNALYNCVSKYSTGKDKFTVLKFDHLSKFILSTNEFETFRKEFDLNSGLNGFGGGTGIEDALLNAIEVLKEDKGNESKEIILFTDGETNNKYTSLTLNEIISKARENNINIVTIGYGTHVDNEYLSKISDASGGNLYRIYKKEEFDNLFENVMEGYNRSFDLEFIPCLFGEEVEIEVKLKAKLNNLVDATVFRSPLKKGYSIDVDVKFDKNSSKLEQKYFQALDDLSNYLLENNVSILIEGHTDRVGEDKNNQVLSLQRAETVKTYLITKGINKNRLYTKGLGAKEPAFEYINDSNVNELNRRIEIKIIEN